MFAFPAFHGSIIFFMSTSLDVLEHKFHASLLPLSVACDLLTVVAIFCRWLFCQESKHFQNS